MICCCYSKLYDRPQSKTISQKSSEVAKSRQRATKLNFYKSFEIAKKLSHEATNPSLKSRPKLP